jgi:hypothetical protein
LVSSNWCGNGGSTGTPATQQTDINANTTDQTIGGAIGSKGKFIIPCGFKTDAQCQAQLGNDWGVGANGCCNLHPKLLKVLPGTTNTVQANVCANTSIEATFDQEIDPGSLSGNIIIARGQDLLLQLSVLVLKMFPL